MFSDLRSMEGMKETNVLGKRNTKQTHSLGFHWWVQESPAT